MKITFFASFGLLVSSIGFTNTSKIINPKPQNMVKCEGGTFVKENSIITLSSFWISNEVTNKEFRIFYTYVKNNPDHLFSWVDWVQANKDIKAGQKKERSNYIQSVKCSDIFDNLIDTNVWDTETDQKKYSSYFMNTKFDDYPVVGVPFDGARYYCIWKTETENIKMQLKGLPPSLPYEIPTENQWTYAAQKLTSVNSAKENTLEAIKNNNLNHLGDNVSEWTSTSTTNKDEKNQVVKGGSWKSIADVKERNLIDPKAKKANIGFRIIKPILYERKD
jgi:formylglycine-generating enzyme required for sulfatase activity